MLLLVMVGGGATFIHVAATYFCEMGNAQHAYSCDVSLPCAISILTLTLLRLIDIALSFSCCSPPASTPHLGGAPSDTRCQSHHLFGLDHIMSQQVSTPLLKDNTGPFEDTANTQLRKSDSAHV